mmetsp:Transcript_5831/g.8949  ORF Transcript_5831/g.8949 Transcript_5831/m.8949 type:complete len:126 (-) Transcript_5831:492-869(-)
MAMDCHLLLVMFFYFLAIKLTVPRSLATIDLKKGYSYDIFFQAGDEAILLNGFLTSAPTITASALPSLLPSISPTNPPTITPSWLGQTSPCPCNKEHDFATIHHANTKKLLSGFVVNYCEHKTKV